jgi:formylglycine-generating enzyme required for sulfatase activity
MVRWSAWVLGGLLLLSIRDGRCENYAFIVGIGGYDEKYLTPLGEYPRRDAIEFRDVLLQSGFKAENIVLMTDDLQQQPQGATAGRYLPEGAKIREELQLLLAALERDYSLIIAHAGHGVQFRNDPEPFFCPLDARLDDKSTLISYLWLYDQLKYDPETNIGCKPRQKLLLIDACRNDPASRIFRDSSTGPGLASVTLPQVAPLPEGVVALFSCAEGQQALQHDPLQHGIFFYHVLEGWKGRADGDQDQIVTLDELIAFTKSQTQTYARVQLRAAQNPRQAGFIDGTWELRSLESALELTLIPAGTFRMGGDQTPDEIVQVYAANGVETNREYYADEQPQHTVRITQPFYLGTYEVTQAEWQAVMGSNPSHFASTGDGEDKVAGLDTSRFPVEEVSWYGAIEFCNKLSQRDGLSPYYTLTSVERNENGTIRSATVAVASDGRQPAGSGYRLPTEAEWEYACRAGTSTPFHFGNSANGTQSNICGINPYGTAIKGSFLARTTSVGEHAANAFGLYDMHGNVMEWCFDWYDENAYKSRSGTTSDPAITSSKEDLRVMRGGSWLQNSIDTRSAMRAGGEPNYRPRICGFRVARTP